MCINALRVRHELAQKSLKLAHFCDLHRKSHMLKLILSKLCAETAQQYRGHCLIPGYWLRFLLQEVKIDLQLHMEP